MNILEKAKNKSFWAGVLTALAGLVGGSLSAPEFLISIINLIGGQAKWLHVKSAHLRVKKRPQNAELQREKEKPREKRRAGAFLLIF